MVGCGVLGQSSFNKASDSALNLFEGKLRGTSGEEGRVHKHPDSPINTTLYLSSAVGIAL